MAGARLVAAAAIIALAINAGALPSHADGDRLTRAGEHTITVTTKRVHPDTTTGPVKVVVTITGDLGRSAIRPERRYGRGAWIPFSVTDLLQTWTHEGRRTWSLLFHGGDSKVRFKLVDPDSGKTVAISNTARLTDSEFHQATSIDGSPGTNRGDLPGFSFAAAAGDEFTIGTARPFNSGWSGFRELYSPNGKLLERWDERDNPVFTAPAAGTYTIVIPEFSSVVAWVSSVKVVNVTANGAAVDTSMRGPGQRVEVAFSAAEGQVITYGEGGPQFARDAELESPSGHVFPTTRETVLNGSQASWVAPESGSYRLIFPGGQLVLEDSTKIHAVTPVVLPTGTDNMQLAIDAPGAAAAARIWFEAGQRGIVGWRNETLPDDSDVISSVAGYDWIDTGDGPAFAPTKSGWVTYVLTAGGTGNTGAVEVWVSRSQLLGEVAVDEAGLPAVRSTPERQELGITFHGEAGTLITSYTEQYRPDDRLQSLVGPDGLPVYGHSSRLPRRIWRLPVTGDYTLWTVVDNDDDMLGVLTPIELPEQELDGSEATFRFTGDSDTFVVPFTATAGETVNVRVYSPDGSDYPRWIAFEQSPRAWLASPQFWGYDTNSSFVAPSTSTYFVAIQAEAPWSTSRIKVSLSRVE